ncbi:hypothetical protein EJ08DRAFT_577191, partial [Tothia fuscella]
VTPDGSCGGTRGYTCTGSQGGIQPCCSSGGFCGNGPLYCGVGCQPLHGSCVSTSSTRMSSSATPSASGGVTPDGSCGGVNGYTCTGIQGVYLPCCSQFGFCGVTDTYCGTGCQPGFGICASSTPSIPPHNGGISPDGTCGGALGYTCLNSFFGSCCSEFNYCGGLQEYCGTGCQSAYGSCNNPNPTGSSSKPATSSQLGG